MELKHSPLACCQIHPSLARRILIPSAFEVPNLPRLRCNLRITSVVTLVHHGSCLVSRGDPS
jgi:hypothetical protein